MKRILLSMLAVAILWTGGLGAARLPAQEVQTIATISISGYDELLADVDFIGKLGGNPETAQGLEMMLQMMTGGKGAAGLDKTKPIGVVVQTDGMMGFPVYGFIPVTDLDELVGLVMGLQGADVPAKPADGVYELKTPGAPPVFAVQKGGWAFVSNQRETLANVPADPSTLLAGLSDKYDVAVKASVANVPDPMKQMAKMQIGMISEMGMQRQPGEDDEQFAMRKAATQRMVKQVGTLIDELDEVLLGVTIDRDAGNASVEFEITAVEGTKTADQFAQMAEATTNFAGFDLPGAAMTGNIASTLSDDDLAQLQQTLAQARQAAIEELKNQELPADQAKLATDLLSDLLDVAEATVAGRKIDAGMVAMVEPGAATVVLGGAVAKGDTLDALLKRVVQMVPAGPMPLAQMIKFDAETHQGVRMHTFSMPVPAEDGVRLIGDTLEVAVGIGDTSVYVAAGTNAVATIKQVIDKSKAEPDKKVAPMRLVVSATPIAKSVANAAPEGDPAKMFAEMVVGMLEQAEGQDKLILSVEGITNGSKMRLELQQGLLQLIGQAGGMAGGMMGGPGGGMPGGDFPGGDFPAEGPADDDPFGDSPF